MVGWGIIETNFANEQLFYEEVQGNLVELEGLIHHQNEENWSEPHLVTTKLGDVQNGLYLSIQNGQYLHTLSNSDREVLEKLSAKLRQYPTDKLYEFATITETDQKQFEDLQQKLREAGLGLNVTISQDWDTFMAQVAVLEKQIDAPLQ